MLSTGHEQLSTEFSPIGCVHYGLCSGCTLDAGWAKPPLYLEMEQEFGRPVPLISLGCKGWRHRAKLAVRGISKDPQMGLFKQSSHDVLSIPHCQVHHPAINQAVSALLSHPLSPYQEKTGQGSLRYLQLTVSRETGKIQLVLVVHSSAITREIRSLVQELSSDFRWHSIWLNYQPRQTNTILSSHFEHVWGDPFLEQPIGRARISLHPGAFCQAHLPLFDRLLTDLEEWVPLHSRFVELYAGAGAISLHLASRLASAQLVESNPFSAESFYASHPPPHISYLKSAVEQTDIPDGEVLFVDPPRKGLGKALIDRIQTKRLIYLSCDFESFRRDHQELKFQGYHLQQLKGYILFPGTNHIESLALFDRA